LILLHCVFVFVASFYGVVTDAIMRMSVPPVLSDLIDTHNDLKAPRQMKRSLSNEGPQILLKR
jgi:hypothetical protein